VGPVPKLNNDVKLEEVTRTASNFYIPEEENYVEMLQHLLVVAYGTAETIAAADPKHPNTSLARMSLRSLGMVYEMLSDFRKRNWYRQLPGILRFSSLLVVPNHGTTTFSVPVEGVIKMCEEAKDAYKKTREST
jgi:hypothetical protein